MVNIKKPDIIQIRNDYFQQQTDCRRFNLIMSV